MNEPIQEKAPKPPGLLPKNVQSWLIVGTRRSDGRHHVADRWQEAATPAKAVRPGAAAVTARSERNKDCRTAEPHPGSPARATRRAECTRAAEPRSLGRGSVPTSNRRNRTCAQQSGRRTHRRSDPGRAKEARLSLAVRVERRLSYRKSPRNAGGTVRTVLSDTGTTSGNSSGTSTEAALLSQMLKDAQLGAAPKRSRPLNPTL